jgi:hypothetical protein
MHQLEIQFFWPLTEQIPLELDYECCDTRPKITASNLLCNTGFTVAAPTWNVRPVLQIEPDAITLRMNKPIPWYRKMLYKLLGMNVEEK